MRETAKQLNAATRGLTAESSKSARSQTMALAVATELGCSRKELIELRSAILFANSKLVEKRLQLCIEIADEWNSAFERGEEDILNSVRSGIGSHLEKDQLEAFERAASKIQPIRP